MCLVSLYLWFFNSTFLFSLLSFFFSFFLVFRAILMAYACSQARGQIRTTASSLCHSSAGSKPCLQPTQQLTAKPDCLIPTHWARPGSNPHPHGYWLDLFPLCHRRNSLVFLFELTFFSFLKTILIFLIYIITPCDLVKYFSWYISMLTFKLNKTHCMFVYSGLNVGDCIVVSTIYEKLPVIQDKETIKWEIIM